MGDSQGSVKPTGLMKGGWRRSLIRDARGAVAVYVAIAVPVLFGVGAMTLDIGRLITLHTELQAAADGAAIAGARELDRFPGAIKKAKEAAAEALKNNQTFATGTKQAILDTTELQTDCRLDPALGVPCIRFLRSLPQNDGKYGHVAFRTHVVFRTQENRKIRPSVGCGENSVPSTVVRGV